VALEPPPVAEPPPVPEPPLPPVALPPAEPPPPPLVSGPDPQATTDMTVSTARARTRRRIKVEPHGLGGTAQTVPRSPRIQCAIPQPMRSFNRGNTDTRPVILTPGANKHAEGSCLVQFGDTHVLCTCSVEDRVPPHVFGSGGGWVTAEYGMLPRSTHERTAR